MVCKVYTRNHECVNRAGGVKHVGERICLENHVVLLTREVGERGPATREADRGRRFRGERMRASGNALRATTGACMLARKLGMRVAWACLAGATARRVGGEIHR